ncbi:MAG TPA: ATP-binding protein, partial [Longimicrobiales bacterium]|nr:ATP-binding protein [Longimicrobiales bacterium]
MTLVASAHVTRLHEAHEALDVSEQALRRSESHYRSLVEYAPFGVLRCTLDGVVLSANRALAEILRYDTAREIVGKHLLRDVYERDHDWEDLKASLAVEVMSPFTEIAWRRGDGSSSRVRTRFRVVRGDPGEGAALLGFVEDVTERQGLEDRLRQAQKMEAVGQLAGGVAHDFNNILAAMMMHSELMGMGENLSEDVREGLLQIRGYAERAANLTRQLLLFSRKQVMQPRELDLNEVVSSLAKMLQRIIGEDVRLQLSLHPTPLMTRADAGMLDQILMNLSVNARDAMPAGGRLVIETGEKIVDADLARLHPDAEPGRYASLSVSDTGDGIPRDVLPHIFEPFFTTKESGKGTGLGLATVFGIVKQHRGWLT